MNSIYKIIVILSLLATFHSAKMTAQQKSDSLEQESFEALNLIRSQQYEMAIPRLEKMVNVLQNNNESNELIAIYQKALGTCYLSTGKIKEAENIFLTALNSIDSPEYAKHQIVRLLFDALSTLYFQTHNYEKASDYSNRAKILFEENLDFGDEYVRCLSNFAVVQAAMGYQTYARMLVDVALRQAKSNFNDTNLDPQSYIALQVIPYVTLLSNASYIYQNLGYFSDAVKTVKESIRIAEKYGLNEAYPYNNLGTLYSKKSKFSQSANWFLKSYQLSKTYYEKNETGFNSALVLYLSNDSRAADFSIEVSNKLRNNIQEMFAFMSGEERSMYWKHVENYLLLLNLIIYESDNMKHFGTVYNNILESKGLLLRSTNAIRDAILNSGNKDDVSDFTRICLLKQQLLVEKEEENRSAIVKEVERLEKKLTQHVNSYADFAGSKTINWKDVQDALLTKDAAIEFFNIPLVWGKDSVETFDGEPRFCAVLLKKGYEHPHIIPLCTESKLNELDKEDLYENDSIYRLIWKPLEEELEGVENIYFAADRDLHKIGIEYAPLPEGGIIGDKYNIYRVSSTRVLTEDMKDRSNENAVLYGGLNYDMNKDDLIAESRSGNYHNLTASRAFSDENLRYGVKYLPGTLKEVNEIAENFSNKPRVITDINGTEESFKSLAGTSIDIIHLATHGFFWSEEDAERRNYVSFLNKNNNIQQQEEDKALIRSGLFFSGANIGLKGEETLPDDVEDGVLTALELSNMNLGNVDMVVMSACESGLGETSGEGVFGLQRGFKLAGANTLLMSLWKVDDNATQLLMTDFYKHYLSGKSKQESLKLAQKLLRENSEYSDSRYWAAFILLDGLN